MWSSGISTGHVKFHTPKEKLFYALCQPPEISASPSVIPTFGNSTKIHPLASVGKPSHLSVIRPLPTPSVTSTWLDLLYLYLRPVHISALTAPSLDTLPHPS